ncbi:putative queuine tRNA-ribosyltransferase [Pillotina sp. SPG140]|jgi:queuine tRNA-ribosyltransferase
MPVGTNATVKALRAADVEALGYRLILSNTYHVYLRPGIEVIAAAGGLHEFMGWNHNILTDSGGYQVFSLAPFRKITEEGVQFRSHIDGSLHDLSPEKVVHIQTVFHSDILMPLDVCTPWGISYQESVEALKTTTQWLDRSVKTWKKTQQDGSKGMLFAIVQGNFFRDLRVESVENTLKYDTPGVALGGLSVGEPQEVFLEYLAYTTALLPVQKPRYVMGIGSPDYILAAIENGIDMFDCILPTRTGRTGRVFTRDGHLSLKKEERRFDFKPIDSECSCSVCRSHTRAYLRHLFKTQEILCSILATYHNLYFLEELVRNARQAIKEHRFSSFKAVFLKRYFSQKEE